MSMRRMAFLWLAGLMTAIGLIAAILSYVFMRNEASELLDNQLRQIALYVGDARPGAVQPELRTPLFGLQLQADNLRALLGSRRDHDEGTQRAVADSLGVLHHGIRRLSDLVNQLLRLAKYDADPAVSIAVRLDLAGLALAAMARADAFAGERGINLGVVRHEPVGIVANEADIDAILSNLLDNAIRYTPAGGSIDVSVYRSGAEAVVEIQDNGPGIDPALLAKVFERFFRAASAAAEGSGLGLAIAKAAAERNEAGLSLENRGDGAGILAQLRLPAGREGACLAR
jgi:two-component system OmpR family sensor kinase